MRTIKKASLIAAAAALTISPVAASAAQSAQSLSVTDFAQARAGADTVDANELEGGTGIILAILAAAAVIAGIIIAADGSENTPTSP